MPCYALSNWSADKFPVARALYAFLDWFDGIVISGNVGVTKPDPRIFRHLFERHGVDPASAVFVDDTPANIAAAVALGMTGLRYEGADALRRDLRRLGFPIAAAAG